MEGIRRGQQHECSFKTEVGYKMVKRNEYQYICKDTSPVDVEIQLLAYNHQDFIAQAMESVLMQQTQYSYKLIISDDCSTDSTRDIVLNYYNQYPDKIALYLWEKNVGAGKSSLEMIKRCTGKYITHLEGDDYWTDPLKLEKQIGFLETHSEFIGTAHNVRCVDKDGNLLHRDFGMYPICEEHIYGKEQVKRFELAGHVASLLYRNIWKSQKKKQIEGFYQYAGNGDTKLNAFLGLSGDVFYFRDVMLDHRRIFEGISWTAKTNNKNILWLVYSYHLGTKKYMEECFNQRIDTADLFYAYFEKSFRKVLCEFNRENIIVYGKFVLKKMAEVFRNESL